MRIALLPPPWAMAFLWAPAMALMPSRDGGDPATLRCECVVIVAVSVVGYAAYLLACHLLGGKLTCGDEGAYRHKPALGETVAQEETPHHEQASPSRGYVQIVDLCTGVRSRSNPRTTTPFDNDVCSGEYCLLHRMPPQSSHDPSDVAKTDEEDPYAAHFHGRARLWEVRFRCTFKQPVACASLRLAAAPIERIQVGVRQAALHRFFVGLIGPAADDFYTTPGDDPAGRDPSDIEAPGTSIPLYSADQHIPCAEGELPPRLLDPSFSCLGWRKAADRAGFRASLRDHVFQPGEVHTFAFWGPSRLVNLISWQAVGVPLCADFSLDALNGPPPVVLSLYRLGPPIEKTAGRRDSRHLPGRIRTLVRVCGWSSLHPPSLERLRLVEELITAGRRVGSARDAGHRTPTPTPAPALPAHSCFGWFLPQGLAARTGLRACLGHKSPGGAAVAATDASPASGAKERFQCWLRRRAGARPSAR
mmetsp:Transcript_93647/g.269613  ORF Transcript_93647/g.269613 Transcript_93647/m.269613 type:complete len:476 (+) Transcript_93647:70-1497(+)